MTATRPTRLTAALVSFVYIVNFDCLERFEATGPIRKVWLFSGPVSRFVHDDVSHLFFFSVLYTAVMVKEGVESFVRFIIVAAFFFRLPPER